MGFVTFDDIEQLIPEVISKQIADPDRFEYYEGLAAKIIRDEAGITIPVDEEAPPDWIIVPAAYIIVKLVSTKTVGLKPETIERIDKDYKDAINSLRKHVSNGIATPFVFGRTGAIETVMQW